MKRIRDLAYPYIVWLVIFIVVPLFMVLYYAFTKDGSFTFANFGQIFAGTTLKSIIVSFKIAFITTVITLLIAYPFAYYMTKLNMNYRTLAMMLIMVPMWMNFLLRS